MDLKQVRAARQAERQKCPNWETSINWWYLEGMLDALDEESPWFNAPYHDAWEQSYERKMMEAYLMGWKDGKGDA